MNRVLIQSVVATVLIMLCSDNSAVAQTGRPVGKIREAVTLPVDSQVVKALATAEDLAREKKWAQSIAILQQLIEQQAGAIVPVEPGRYRDAADYCHFVISHFPDEGLKLYRERVDEQVRGWYELGSRENDEVVLRRVINLGLMSSFGDDAANALAELAFEQGRLNTARYFWEILLPDLGEQAPAGTRDYGLGVTYPDPDQDAATIRARLVLCSIYEGDSTRAKRELAAFRRLHAGARGELAGESGLLVELLDRNLRDASQWSIARRAAVNDWANFGGNESRTKVTAPPVDPLTVSWNTPLPLNSYSGTTLRPALGRREGFSTFPIVVDGVAFVCGPTSVRAFDTRTGKPMWPDSENSDGTIYSSRLTESPDNDSGNFQGVPFFAMSAARGRVYARLGAPVLRRSRAHTGFISEIVGFDVAHREGQAVFRVSSDVLDEPPAGEKATSWCFEGTPVVADDRVYVSARRSIPEDEIHVACFDEETGELIWRRRVCAALRNVPEHFSLIGHRLLTLAEGRLFLDTGAGAIACLEADTGKLLWVSTYEVVTNDETPFEFSDTSRHGLTPCVFADGIVFAAPSEARSILAFDAASGKMLWSQKVSDSVLHLLGVTQGKLIASGRNLWALDMKTGAFSWPSGAVGFKDAPSFGSGRGVITEAGIYWPLREEILLVSAESGELIRRFAVQEATQESVGNLCVAEGRLLVATSNRLLALGEVPLAPPNPKRVVVRHSQSDATEFVALPVGTNRNSTSVNLNQGSIDNSKGTKQDDRRREALQWPVKRDWERAIVSESSVRLVAEQGGEALVLVQSGSWLRALGTADGKELWHAGFSEPVSWSALSNERLLLASGRHIEGRDPRSGRVLWRFGLRQHDRIQQLHLTGDGGLAAATERQVTLIDVSSGKVRQLIRPSRTEVLTTRLGATSNSSVIGALGIQQSRGRSLLAFDSSRLREPVLFDVTFGRVVKAVPQLRGAAQCCWLSGPDDVQLLSVGRDNLLECRTIEGARLWTSDHRPAVAFQQPQLITSNGRIVLIEDGLFARGLNPVDGRVIWTVPLGREPVRNLTDCVACESDSLVTVSGSSLSCVDVASGKRRWSTDLGAGQWSVRFIGDDTICVGTNGRDEALQISAFDTESGHALQSLRIDGLKTPTGLVAHAGSDVAIITSGDRLIALRGVLLRLSVSGRWLFPLGRQQVARFAVSGAGQFVAD